ncbi:MAG: DNA adenine methylase [Cyanobacteria bacterium P01_F01_bin.86]
MITVTSPRLAPRPFLKWAGGKGRLIEQYQPYFPRRFRRYCEPFLGGGAIFFHLSDSCQQARLADLNEELVNVYACVQNEVEAVIELLERHRLNHCQTYYYAVRSQVTLTSPTQRAARLIYLNKTCFNGLYRENSKGYFNVPMGRYKNPKICDAATLRLASQALQCTDIAYEPFTDILEHAYQHDDFVYFDPPYHPISATSSFTGYSRYGFNAEDQVRLQQTFACLADRGVQVMLSNSDCPFIRDLYHDFHIHEIQASRAINSNAKRRGKISELLITSYSV